MKCRGCRCREPENGLKTCALCRARSRHWTKQNPEKNLAKSMRDYWKNRDERMAKSDRYRLENRERLNAEMKRRNMEIRRLVIDHYGGACACCGEPEIRFLGIDHINNDGASHRREFKTGAGSPFYWWIKRNNFPEGLFQVLCHNCNLAKGFYGQCPHKGLSNTRIRKPVQPMFGMAQIEAGEAGQSLQDASVCGVS